MKATVNITAGEVRIYSGSDRNKWAPRNVEPSHAPYSIELEGEWAIGSASKAPNVVPGTFTVTALEDGKLRWFKATTDAYGNVVSSTDSEPVEMKAGDTMTYTTHDSNAYTIRSTDLDQPEQQS